MYSVPRQRPPLILITIQRFYLNSITLESLISKCRFWRTHSIFFAKLIALQKKVNCNSLYVYWYIYCAVVCYLNSGHESVRCVLNEDFKCIFEDYIFEDFKWWYTNIGNWRISLNSFTSSTEAYDSQSWLIRTKFYPPTSWVTLRLFPGCSCSLQKRQNYNHGSQNDGSKKKMYIFNWVTLQCIWYYTLWINYAPIKFVFKIKKWVRFVHDSHFCM